MFAMSGNVAPFLLRRERFGPLPRGLKRRDRRGRLPCALEQLVRRSLRGWGDRTREANFFAKSLCRACGAGAQACGSSGGIGARATGTCGCAWLGTDVAEVLRGCGRASARARVRWWRSEAGVSERDGQESQGARKRPREGSECRPIVREHDGKRSGTGCAAAAPRAPRVLPWDSPPLPTGTPEPLAWSLSGRS